MLQGSGIVGEDLIELHPSPGVFSYLAGGQRDPQHLVHVASGCEVQI